jgi:copper chaperone CopZ
MTTTTYNVPAIHCGHCVHTIQTELAELAGVSRVVASLDTKQVTVDFDPPADEVKIRSLLQEINYPAA